MTDEEVAEALSEARASGDLEAARRWTRALMTRAEDELGDFNNVSLGYREDLADLCEEAGDLAEAEQHYDYLVRHSRSLYGASHHRTERRAADLARIRALRRGGGAAASEGPTVPEEQRPLVLAVLAFVILASLGYLAWKTGGEEAFRRSQLVEGSSEWVKVRRKELARDMKVCLTGSRTWWQAAQERADFEEAHGDPGKRRKLAEAILLEVRPPLEDPEPGALVRDLVLWRTSEVPASQWKSTLELLGKLLESSPQAEAWLPLLTPALPSFQEALAEGRRSLVGRYVTTFGESHSRPASDLRLPGEASLASMDSIRAADALVADPRMATPEAWGRAHALLEAAHAALPPMARNPVFRGQRHLERKIALALAGAGRYEAAHARYDAVRQANPESLEQAKYLGIRSEYLGDDPRKDAAAVSSLAFLVEAAAWVARLEARP